MKDVSAEQNNKPRTNVVLIGMPGAGKSTVGVVLAKILGRDFLDADLVIQKSQMKTLQDIIDEKGPLGFIEVENQVLQTIDVEYTIISTGGSAVYSDEAMAYLATLGPVVYLSVTLDELKERLGDLAERGVVMKDGHGMGLDALYAERLPLYEKWADITVEVGDLSITDTARAVVRALREYEER